MFEIILGVFMCVTMGKIASADDQSGVVWGFITFAFCLIAMLIPLPFIRLGIAGVGAFATLMAYKMIGKR